ITRGERTCNSEGCRPRDLTRRRVGDAAYNRMKKVIVTSGWGAGYPEGGGMQWLNLHYLAGLRALGVEPFWLDMMGPSKKTEELVGAFRARCERFGFGENWAVIYEGKRFFGMDEH